MCDMKWRCQPFNTLMFELKRVLGGVTADPKTTREQDLVTYSQTPLKISLPSPWVSPEPVDHVKKREERRQNAKVQHGFLANPENLVRLFDEALAKEGWLENDFVPDMLPQTRSEREAFGQLDVIRDRLGWMSGKWIPPDELPSSGCYQLSSGCPRR